MSGIVKWLALAGGLFAVAAMLRLDSVELLNAIVWPLVSVLLGVELAVLAILAAELPSLEQKLMEHFEKSMPLTDGQRTAIGEDLRKPIAEIRQNVVLGIWATVAIGLLVLWSAVDVPLAKWGHDWPLSKIQFIYFGAMLATAIVLRGVYDTVEALFTLGEIRRVI